MNINRRPTSLIWIILLLAILPIIGACSKSRVPEGPVFEAEGYVIGYHPCVANATVQTKRGKGKGYLVATTGAKPDTLMVYGVPADMFDIPDEWFSDCGYLLPEKEQKKFKMKFSYQLSEIEFARLFVCKARCPSPDFTVGKYTPPEYIIIKAEKME